MRHVFGDPDVPQYAPSRTYHVENYRVVARIDMAKGEIFGNVAITMPPLQPGLGSFYVDSSQLVIDTVTLESEDGDVKPLQFRLDDPKLWITLDRSYSPVDALKIRIAYHSKPQGRPFPDAGPKFHSSR